jgi:hypothetical protein
MVRSITGHQRQQARVIAELRVRTSVTTCAGWPTCYGSLDDLSRKAGSQTLTAADPLPDDLSEALAKTRS